MSEEYVSVLDRLLCKFGRNDEELNIEIAEEICAEENAEKKSVVRVVLKYEEIRALQ